MSLFKSIFGKGSKYESKGEELILEIKGTVEYERGRVLEAINIYSHGIKTYPKNPYFHYLRGNAKEDLKQWDEAISDFKKYLEINKDHYNALFRIGLCYQNSERFDLALKYYDRAEESYEMSMTTANEIALLRKKDFNGNYYSIPKEKIFNNRATVKSSLGDFQGAIRDCNSAISINPQYPIPYFIRGVEFLKANEKEKAKSDLLKASDLGHSMADQVLQQFFGEDENADFFNQVRAFAESEEARQRTGGTRFRTGFEQDLRSNLATYGTPQSISHDTLLKEAADYSYNMWLEYERHNEINDFIKAFISYEVSLAFKKIRPDIDELGFWKESLRLAYEE